MENNTFEELSIESVRASLIRQEDTIVFSLIERAKFPLNSRIYNESLLPVPGFRGSMIEYYVKESEILQSKVGRYVCPEEHPFFPDDLPQPLLPPHDYPQVLYPAADLININKTIWDMYFNQLLPLFTTEGDDGNYASTAECDLKCLQALSRRIHYGKFVAEIKFRNAPDDYGPAIGAQDRDTLMKLLTFETVEEMVKRRVEKKAMVFGKEVTLSDKGDKPNCKIEPAILSLLYGEWVMPLTKLVEVEYLLLRLD